MIDFEFSFYEPDQVSVELAEWREESWCLLSFWHRQDHSKSPWLVNDFFERVHDNAENRVMTPGITALIEYSFTVVKYTLEGFFVTTGGALGINSFPSVTKVVFVLGTIKKCFKQEFHDPFWEIISKH